MITAAEARKRIESMETERAKREMETAERAVNAAVDKGENNCWLGIYISDATANYLKSLGYTVYRMNDQRDGSDTQLSWN